MLLHRALFVLGSVVEAMAKYLAADANLVKKKQFESAVVKLLYGE